MINTILITLIIVVMVLIGLKSLKHLFWFVVCSVIIGILFKMIKYLRWKKMLILPEPLRNFLNTPLINLSWIWLDYWSIVHFFSGVVLGFVFWKLKKWYRWLIVLILLVCYEIFEGKFWDVYFVPEPKINVVWDLIIGFGGFLVIVLIKKIISKKERKEDDKDVC